MADNYQEHLSVLRNAASTRQWNECRENVRLLLPETPQIAVVHLFVRQIRRFLFDASNTYSDDKSILDEMSSLKDISSLDMLLNSAKRIYAALEKRSNEPGINNFRNALKRLMKLDAIEMLSADHFDTLIDVLSGILMAILDHQWGQQNPELWVKSFRQESRQDAFIRVKHFWPNPQTIQLNKELWNEVADDIETALMSLDQ